MQTRFSPLEKDIFDFLCKKYIQLQDDRQKEMGIHYTTAETHDLAKEMERFFYNYLKNMTVQAVGLDTFIKLLNACFEKEQINE